MVCEYNKKKLQEILKVLHTTLHGTVSVWDIDFNQIIFYPKPVAPLCDKLRSYPCGNKQCILADINACMKARDTKEPYSFVCHAGLVDAMIPVVYKEELVAYIGFGQVRSSDNPDSKPNVQWFKKKNIDQKEVLTYYEAHPILSNEEINSAINMIKMCIPYFFESEAIKPETNELALAIEAYINENITTPLSIKQLSEHFNISINALYQISHKYFKTSIKNFIIQFRIEKAKHYLVNTTLTVSEISSMVGFSNYNFFIRMFRARTGHTPLEYRRNFPLNIL